MRDQLDRLLTPLTLHFPPARRLDRLCIRDAGAAGVFGAGLLLFTNDGSHVAVSVFLMFAVAFLSLSFSLSLSLSAPS